MKKPNNRKALLYAAGIAALLILSLILCLCLGKEKNIPVLKVETPQKPSASQTDTFTLDVTVSSLGDDLYPAMSASIRFDPAYLEFVGIEEGNMFVTDVDLGKALPTWSCNPEQCNKTGLINVMYLDLTGGKAAFRQSLLSDGDHVVFRLTFRLRGSARSGDVYILSVEDAVFAASDERQSLAMTSNTLKAKDGKIMVGD